jgi:hypothetical protein
MQQHVKIVAILFIVFGALYLVLAVTGFVFGAGLAAVVHANAPGNDEGVIGALGVGGCFAVIAGALAILGLPKMIAGWGLLRYRNWARILTIILAIVGLWAFPFGTILGVYALWVLLHPETTRYFGTA